MIKINKQKISLRNEIREILENVRNTVVDMSDVSYLSLSAFHELLILMRKNNLKLKNLNKDIEDILKINIKIRKIKMNLDNYIL